MAIVAKKGESTYEPLAAGNYAARCISMVRVGTIEEEFKGKKKMMDKVVLTWEIPDEQKVFKEENGMQPYVLSRDFTLSMYEKAALRKYLEGWRGVAFSNEEADKFDITKLLDKVCLLNVIHTSKDGKTYANIAGVSPLPKGMTCSARINPLVEFNVTEWNQDIFDGLSEYVQNKIKRSKEYQEIGTTPPKSETSLENITTDDDLPF